MQPNNMGHAQTGVAANLGLVADWTGLRSRERPISISHLICARKRAWEILSVPIQSGSAHSRRKVNPAQLCAAGKGSRNTSAAGILSTTRAKRNQVASG